MCGISGFLGPGLRSEEMVNVATRMADTLRHRGPDDHGTWIEHNVGLGFGFRRLAIIDLSKAGHQPMTSSSGRQVLVFNGEIYNHPDLRRRLDSEGCRFRGHSDTEVLVEAIDRWGLEKALRASTGMFAFAVWDAHRQTLSLARDRMGEKPLYYGWIGDSFLFGSELKALWAHPAFRPEVDRASLTRFLRYGYVPAPSSIFQGIQKLLPGTWIEIRPGSPMLMPEPIAYWSLSEVVDGGRWDQFDLSDREAADQLEILLRDSVARQMLADVPVGALLSGGIDSSTVVALTQAESTRPVRTFTIGFHEADFNEAVHARAVAHHLGTDHTELYVTPEEARDVIPRLPRIYDEPFGDSSQIPTFLIAELARRSVTVSLSGDGGDELFGGYDRYRLNSLLTRTLFRIPGPVRRGTAGLIRAIGPGRFDAVASLLPARYRVARAGDRAHKLAGVLAITDTEDIYRHLMSHWKDPDQVVLSGGEGDGRLGNAFRWPTMGDDTDRAMYLDAVTYLPDDLLVKVDRATMAVSLEARLPLLDHRVVEFAWRLPRPMKIRNGKGKWLLRHVLARHVPGELTDRPKMGFGVPVGDWLRGPLREWAEGLLTLERVNSEGFLEADPIRAAWADHVSGRSDRAYQLWNVLMFQAWVESLPNGVSAS